MEQSKKPRIKLIGYDCRLKESYIITMDCRRFRTIKTTFKVVQTLCNNADKDYIELRNQAMKLLDIKQKVPIMVSKNWGLLLFPVNDVSKTNNLWINYLVIKRIKSIGYEYSLVIFEDDSELCIKSNIRVIRRQLQRCEKLCRHLVSL